MTDWTTVDGFCVLEISLTGYAVTARISSLEIKAAATALVGHCVQGMGMGGKVEGVGECSFFSRVDWEL